jgi:glutamine amidotransferase
VIALVDYGAGNLTSVRKAFAALQAEVRTPASPAALARARAIVIPGVGHFGATAALDRPWREAILAAVRAGTPLLGICLGMQWLFEGSDEAPELPGLGLIAGRCRRLASSGSALPGEDPAGRLKVPHVGWNALELVRPSRLLAGVADGAHAYFTHAYAAPVTADCVAATTHGERFASAVEHGRSAGVQFHPEKSGAVGLTILRNFLSALAGEDPPC